MNAARSAEPAPVSPGTARGDRSRPAIVKAARAAEKDGHFDTNVADISRRAPAAHGTFSTYFSSKGAQPARRPLTERGARTRTIPRWATSDTARNT